MPKYLLDIWLDGYNTPEEEKEACDNFIDEQLDITASSVTFKHLTETSQEPTIEQLAELWNLCQEFIKEYKPLCEESITQVEDTNLACPELVEKICNCVGYYKEEEEDED
jgi:hypothetical protein